jgi:hypothetical protein
LGNQHLPLYSQESNSEFSKIQSLLEAKKWLLPIEKQSLCWATISPICVVPTSVRWDVDAIELLSKYGLTRQLENWQKVGGSRSGGGFPSSSAFVTVNSWRSDGDIQPITNSCLLHWRGLNVRSPT